MTRMCIRKAKTIGGMSIRLACVLAMMRVNDVLNTFFFDYRRQHDLAIKVVRIFNTYGPRMHPNDGRVVSNYRASIKRQKHHDLR